MLDNWIVQNLIWTMLAAVAGAALTRLRSKHQKTAEQAQFFLVTFVSLWLGVSAYRWSTELQLFEQRFAPRITSETAERVIRAWMDKPGWTVERTSAPDIRYGFVVRLPTPNDVPLVVAETTTMRGFVTIQSSLILSGDHRAKYAKLPKQAARALNRRITLELNRLNFGYEGLMVPMDRIAIMRMLPITEELTEFQLLKTLQEVLSGVVMVRQILAEVFEEPVP